MGYCSRKQGCFLIQTGRVTLNGRLTRDPEKPVDTNKDTIRVDGVPVAATQSLYLMLNKPRGLVTTTHDEQGRDTVYECFKGHAFPHLSAVGRLDKASEGLLLFTNDHTWANQITDPATHLAKIYHVQVAGRVDEALLQKLAQGAIHDGEKLALKSVTKLREGEKNTWLEIVLDEGRNRHIRRVLEAYDLETLRLVRVAIGSLKLGDLQKSAWRHLSAAEVAMLGAQA